MTYSEETRAVCVGKVVFDGMKAVDVARWYNNTPNARTISEWVQYFVQTGRAVLPPLHSGAHDTRTLISGAALEYLLGMVVHENDSYLQEYIDRIADLFGLRVSIATMYRTLMRCGKTRKVSIAVPPMLQSLPPASPPPSVSPCRTAPPVSSPALRPAAPHLTTPPPRLAAPVLSKTGASSHAAQSHASPSPSI
jgi:transposase